MGKKILNEADKAKLIEVAAGHVTRLARELGFTRRKVACIMIKAGQRRLAMETDADRVIYWRRSIEAIESLGLDSTKH